MFGGDEMHWRSSWIHFIHQVQGQVTTKHIAGCIVNIVHVLNKTIKIGMGSLDQRVWDLRLKFAVRTYKQLCQTQLFEFNELLVVCAVKLSITLYTETGRLPQQFLFLWYKNTLKFFGEHRVLVPVLYWSPSQLLYINKRYNTVYLFPLIHLLTLHTMSSTAVFSINTVHSRI
jgi:hypothetical protein